ncbi:MAG: hypothetical protein ACAI44_29435 [Candidatus Sericytochromatia bacterium]
MAESLPVAKLCYHLLAAGLLLACTTVSTPAPTPTGSPSPRKPNPVPTAVPEKSPSPVPAVSASPEPTSTATPVPTPTPDGIHDSSFSLTSFFGRIYDDLGQPVRGAEISVRFAPGHSDGLPAYEEKTLSEDGNYQFRHAPIGYLLEIRVSKPGYNTVQRIEVLKSGCLGYLDCNRFDFGAPADQLATSDQRSYALTHGLQIVSLTGLEGTPTSLALKLKFSEPIDRGSLEQNLSVYGPPLGCWAAAPDDALTHYGSEVRILGSGRFHFVWDTDSQGVSITSASGYALPPLDDRARSCSPYRLEFKALRNQAGEPASRLLYRSNLGPTTGPSTGPSFELRDSTPLQVLALTATPAGLSLKFNKPMRYRLPDWGGLAAGLDGEASVAAAGIGPVSAKIAAGNYDYEILRAGKRIASGNFGRSGWSATYSESDDASIELIPGMTLSAAGDTLLVHPSQLLLGPAGSRFTVSDNTLQTVVSP